ncbi:hypothetical protein ABZS61_34465 [Streptomyces sp. NPDC005566]|uniref:hypothetical protein n=1 Tax=Streptomyces sp. NPDC005566 TaxID=3156886 RepID=UPI0033B2FD36
MTATAAGSPVPCQSGRPARTALPPDYQPIISVLEAEARLGRDRTRAKELAMALGLEAVPAKIEGVRSRAKRLAERGWITGHQSEKFSIVTP